jgi:hypothetical protein
LYDIRLREWLGGERLLDGALVLFRWDWWGFSIPSLSFLLFLFLFYPLHSAFSFPSCLVWMVYWVCSEWAVTVGRSRLSLSSQWRGHFFDPRALMIAVSGNSRSSVSDFGFLRQESSQIAERHRSTLVALVALW